MTTQNLKNTIINTILHDVKTVKDVENVLFWIGTIQSYLDDGSDMDELMERLTSEGCNWGEDFVDEVYEFFVTGDDWEIGDDVWSSEHVRNPWGIFGVWNTKDSVNHIIHREKCIGITKKHSDTLESVFTFDGVRYGITTKSDEKRVLKMFRKWRKSQLEKILETKTLSMSHDKEKVRKLNEFNVFEILNTSGPISMDETQRVLYFLTLGKTNEEIRSINKKERTYKKGSVSMEEKEQIFKLIKSNHSIEEISRNMDRRESQILKCISVSV